MLRWIRDTYKGYLWPWLILFPALGWGQASETHSAWHYAEWPCAVVALVATSWTASKFSNSKGK